MAGELFGPRDFVHTLLTMLATRKLTPKLVAAKAASVGVGCRVTHNVFYVAFALLADWLADRFPKRACWRRASC